jgi:hypothetical protein
MNTRSIEERCACWFSRCQFVIHVIESQESNSKRELNPQEKLYVLSLENETCQSNSLKVPKATTSKSCRFWPSHYIPVLLLYMV